MDKRDSFWWREHFDETPRVFPKQMEETYSRSIAVIVRVLMHVAFYVLENSAKCAVATELLQPLFLRRDVGDGRKKTTAHAILLAHITN